MSSDTVDLRYILGVLNSALGRFLTKLYVTQLQQRQFRMLAQYVTRFPIPKEAENGTLIDLVAKEIDHPSGITEDAINLLVEHLYGLTEEESLVIRQMS